MTPTFLPSLALLAAAVAAVSADSPSLFQRRMSSTKESHKFGVQFDVVHHEKVTPVGMDAHLEDYAHTALPTGTMCGSDDLSLTLFFKSEEDATAWSGAAGEEPTLVGNCFVKGSSGEQRPVKMRAVTGVWAGDSKEAPGFFELHLTGEEANAVDIFLHANVTAELKPEEEAAVGELDAPRKLAQVSAGKDCDANDIASGKCTEQFKGQTVRLPSVVNWNSNGFNLYSSGGASVKTKSCSIRISPTVYFELGITLSKITKFSIAAQGTLNAAAGFGFEASASKSISATKKITQVNLPIVSFTIGPFPFVIAPSVPIEAGVFFAVNGKASFSADASYSGSVSAGVRLSGSSLQPQTSINFPSPRKATPQFSSTAEVQVTAKAWISAALSFNVQGLAQLAVKATQTISATAKVSTSGPRNAQVDGKFDAVVAGSLGAKLAGVSIPPRVTLRDRSVYSRSFLLWRK